MAPATVRPEDWPVASWGDGDRRALLVHGLSSSKEGWWRLGPAIAGLGFTVTAPDLRGHGEAPRDGDRRIDTYADDLLALGDRWDLVLGHSLGGAASLRAASRRLGWADRLVLEDPALVILDAAAAAVELLADFEHPLTAEQQRELNPTWHPEDARIKAEALAASGPDAVRRSLADNPDWNVVAEVVALTVPTLLVGADPAVGAIVPPELGRSIAELNDLVRFEWVEGGSHSIHRDEFDAFLGIVAAWLAEPI